MIRMKLCASRAFWLVAYPSQGHEMLFDAHMSCLAGLGRRARHSTRQPARSPSFRFPVRFVHFLRLYP